MLHECIIFLIDDLTEIESTFEAAKKGREFNFVIDIQPFTERIDAHLTELMQYEETITALRLMNPLKLELLVSHIRELSVSCFFDRTSKKMFIDQFKAAQHDLHYIERQTK
ncbi:DUF1798 family protein [Macrococcus equipercicus]|uniref:DUF1798 family protein n=1 Tax=Macrococcus equipercicus TaxID=69967 RepID=A0ABQ6RA92_9STAP|nr:DUF1798 family protein [Macrococcus equipercicus]KAA1040211.1 DUF1798 family protein [Macrococcus equipercicus]